MNANSLKNHRCPGQISAMKDKSPRYEYMGEGVEVLCKRLVGGESYDSAYHKSIEHMFNLYMSETGFDFQWQRELYFENDSKAIKRAFDYVLDGSRVIEVNIWCEVSTEMFDGVVKHKVDLVVQRENGRYVAVSIHSGKNLDRTEKGRTTKALPQYNPSAVVAKHCLEGKYPGIMTWDIYLTNMNDTDETVVETFDDSGRKGAQIMVVSYENLPECLGGDKKFSMERFLELERKAFEEPGEPACNICEMQYACVNGFPKLDPRYEYVEEENKEEGAYVLPTFSKEQREVIEHVDGPFVVSAGPGSGKTAVLVGRLNHLVTVKKVPPEFILAITFTKKAAGEISRRLNKLFDGGELVTVSTLNALGYSILQDNAEKLGIDTKKLLTDDVVKTFINDLLADFGRIRGIKYSLKKGVNGYPTLIKKHIEKYMKCDEAERVAYLEKNGLGNDFVEFANRFMETVKAGGFITYEEQISLCVKLLNENDILRRTYQSLYWYVCVDEYQDINATQFEFIRILAGRENLMAIGDDDQAIFGFQGGSAEYMLRFSEYYPNADKYLLTLNFRSSANIVSVAAANAYLGADRLEKDIKAVKGPGAEVSVEVSESPAVRAGQLVGELIKSGCKEEDIAVLSYKNSTLESVVSENEDIPFKVEGEKLCRNAFFTLLRTVLRLRKDIEDRRARLEYFALYGLPIPEDEEFHKGISDAKTDAPYVEQGNAECAYSVLKSLIMKDYKFKEFFERAAFIAGYINQKVYAQILDELKNRGVYSLDKFLETAEAMVFAEDSMEASVDYPGKVICTTVHKAKGREWKYVIVIDDFGSKETADTRRVIYTAITRAIDGLYLLKNPKASLLIA